MIQFSVKFIHSFFLSPGKSYTMLGAPENANTLGIIPCAISWLFRGINEQKQKTGARFSVRVSAVEVCGPTNQLRDLLAGHSSGKQMFSIPRMISEKVLKTTTLWFRIKEVRHFLLLLADVLSTRVAV